MREKPRLRVFKNRVLRRVFEPKRDELTGSREDNTGRSYMICIPQLILLG
jgi:hypothetical protein